MGRSRTVGGLGSGTPLGCPDRAKKTGRVNQLSSQRFILYLSCDGRAVYSIACYVWFLGLRIPLATYLLQHNSCCHLCMHICNVPLLWLWWYKIIEGSLTIPVTIVSNTSYVLLCFCAQTLPLLPYPTPWHSSQEHGNV
jgi:hypothetical protein